MSVKCCNDHGPLIGVGSTFALITGLGAAGGIKGLLWRNTLEKVKSVCCAVLQNPPTESCKALLSSIDYFRDGGWNDTPWLCSTVEYFISETTLPMSLAFAGSIVFLGLGVGASYCLACTSWGANWRERISIICSRKETQPLLRQTEESAL